MTVDEFVATKVLPQFRDVVEMVRQLMRECAPETQELISYGIPAWKGRKILAVVNPTKKDITFSFSRGSQFEDRYGLLRGVGKSIEAREAQGRADGEPGGAAVLHRAGAGDGREVGRQRRINPREDAVVGGRLPLSLL